MMGFETLAEHLNKELAVCALFYTLLKVLVNNEFDLKTSFCGSFGPNLKPSNSVHVPYWFDCLCLAYWQHTGMMLEFL